MSSKQLQSVRFVRARACVESTGACNRVRDVGQGGSTWLFTALRPPGHLHAKACVWCGCVVLCAEGAVTKWHWPGWSCIRVMQAGRAVCVDARRV